MKADFLIIGAGIAGTLLARALARRGASVHLLHEPSLPGSSRVAAWMVNPVTGIRFVPSWRVDTFLPSAVACYQELAAETGLTIWHPQRIRRFFQGDDERPRWEKKRDQPLIRSFVREEFADGILIDGGGRADLLPWLEKFLLDPPPGVTTGTGEFSPDLADGFHRVVHCTGYGGHGVEAKLPWKPAKGEVLTLRIPGLDLEEIWLRGIFVLPVGGDIFRVGATYEWDDLDPAPTPAGREELLARLCPLTPLPVTVLRHDAAIRPILRDARPVLGMIPGHPRQAIFNGLGSKGALAAPWLAGHFAAHLLDDIALDPEVDIRWL